MQTLLKTQQWGDRQWENGLHILTDTSTKKIHTCQKIICKDTLHHMSLEKSILNNHKILPYTYDG